MQYNKVEISGVNTSSLPVLSESKKRELLEQISKGDMQAREELINGNLRLVLSVLQKFLSRCDSPDDLFQVGVIGLIKAIDNFDLSLDVKFSTYAVPMIMGELRRFLRDSSPVRVSRSMRDLAYKAMQERERLTNENKAEPTIDEIANSLGVKRCEIVTALEAMSVPLSLYEPVFSDAGDTIYIMDQLGDNTSDTEWLSNLALREAMQNLEKRERNIINLRYYQGKTQMEVAQEIGISQAQVSRLEKSVLEKLRNEMI